MIDDRGALTRVELGGVEDIVGALTRWRAAIGAPLAAGLDSIVSDQDALADAERDAGESLRRLVLDPVLQVCGGRRELFVCLDGPLHLLPLDALPLGDGLVGDRYVIHTEVSFARLLRKSPASNVEPSLLALGGIDFDATLEAQEPMPIEAAAPPVSALATDSSSTSARSGAPGSRWSPLPRTRDEVEAAAALFQDVYGKNPVVLTDDLATKRALCAASKGARFLHIATHGYFAPDSIKGSADPAPADQLWSPRSLAATVTGLAPMTLCGLTLAGANRGSDSQGRVPGILTAEELAGLDLSSCELAVLSACETSIGIVRAGQGTQSLRAALHASGARTAITSLWRVDDARTRALFADFYSRVWLKHEPKAQALWHAKMTLRNQRAETRDWAAWVLTGDPD